MANIKITDLVTLTEPVSTDVLPIVDVSLDVTKKISIAELLRTAGQGSQTNPGISFDGDTDTGVYSPGANQLAFTTNGSEALRITSGRRVGIGATDPEQKLHVVGSILVSDQATSPGIFLRDDDAAGSVLLTQRNSGDFVLTNGATTRSTIFETGGSESVRITSDGNVGIGTTDPVGLLTSSKTVNGGEGGVLVIQNTGSGVGTSAALYLVPNNGGGNDLARAASIKSRQTITGNYADLGFFTSLSDTPVERLTITSDGNVGIGTTAPVTKLEVAGVTTITSSSTSALFIRDNNLDNNGLKLYSDVAGVSRIDGGYGELALLTAATERVRITSDGLVGIGTTDPDELLHIRGDVAEFKGTNINSIDATGGTEQVFKFGIEGQKNSVYGPAGSIIFRQDNSSWSGVEPNFKPTRIELCTQDSTTTDTSETPRLVVDQNGNVGIGTTNPLVKLEVTAENTSELLRITRTNAGEQAGIGFAAVGTTSRPLIGCRANDFVFDVGGSEAARITSGGLVGIGTTIPGAKLHVNSAGQSTSNIDTTTSIQQIISDSNNSVDAGGSIVFAANNGNWRFAAIKGLVSNGNNNSQGDLAFSVRTLITDSTLSEAMRITSDGLVGIGTTNPVGITPGTTTLAISDPGAKADGDKTGALAFITNDASFTSTYSDGVTAEISSVSDSATGAAYGLAFATATTTATNRAERLRITSNGLVGIGTSSPAANLQVQPANSNTAATAFTVRQNNSADTSQTSLSISIDPTTNTARLDATGTSSPNLAFLTAAQERARFDSEGRLLVGTSSAETIYGATSALQVAGSNFNTASISLLRTGGGAGDSCALYLSRQRSTGILANGDRVGLIAFAGRDTTDLNTPLATIEGTVDGAPGANDMPGRLVFATTASGASTPTERMRIKANGSILFADEDESAITAGTSNGKAILSSSIMYSARATTAAASQIIFTNTNGIVGQISTSGSNTAFSTASDYRLKENVVPLANAADRLNQLQVHRFNFIADPDTTVDGFLAHEAQAVVPECVTGTKDEVDDEGNPVYQCIDQSKIVPLLTAALQEALAKIETLEQRITDAGI